MNKSAVIIGLGEMGSVFARGLLRLGMTVVPVLRDSNLREIAENIANPDIVLVAVGEKDLHPTLEKYPAQWLDQMALLQNELLPRDWQSHGYSTPTVVSVWFEKKKGQDYKVLIPSPIYGNKAQILSNALKTLDIPSTIVASEKALLFELVLKNVYILTTNISGLVTKGNVEDLWENHQVLARAVAADVIDIQEALTGSKFDRDELIDGMVKAIRGDLNHQCMGRSAPARLANAITHADEAQLAVPRLREIAAENL
jgi:ketopantoate reductase